MMPNEAMGGDPRRMRGNRYNIASYAILQADSSRDGQNLWDANQIVGGCRQHEEPFDQRAPAMSGFAQPTQVFIQPNASSICFRLMVLMR